MVAAAAHAATAEDYDRTIRELAGRAAVRSALEQIVEREAGNLGRLIELTEIEAPPFAEAARGKRFAELLSAAGLERVETDSAGNVIGYWPGDGREETLAVVAHLDTVFPAGTNVQVRGPEIEASGQRRWYAPGVGDNARGLVLLLTLVESLIASELHTQRNILFIASVGEEGVGDLRGVKHLFREDGPRIDEFIAIDGGNDQRILNQAIGSHRYRIAVRGPGGHSWGAFGLANPAHALATGIHRFDQMAINFVLSGPRTTFNIGRIGGGTSVNAVPFESWAEVDLRSEDPQRLAAIDALLHREFDRAIAQHNDKRTRGEALTLEYQLIGKRPSGRTAPDSPLIQQALAVARYFDLAPLLGSGSTDANVAIARGIPATTISRGGVSGGSHSLAEWWSDEEVVIGSSKALLLILASAGVGSG
jgi:acetylornithine deacetylase/succinyl-diaminopimelate desuccinylase-like protein